MTYSTLQQSLKTPFEPIIVASREFTYNGNVRKSLTVKKARGRRFYTVVRYETGNYSEAV